MKIATTIGAAVVLLGITACASNTPVSLPDGVEVSGKILLPNGAPVPGGRLILRPVEGLHGASAQIQNDGTFALVDQTGRKAVVPGTYQVFVRLDGAELKAIRSKVNSKYQSSEDGESDILVDIQEARNDLVIKLTK